MAGYSDMAAATAQAKEEAEKENKINLAEEQAKIATQSPSAAKEGQSQVEIDKSLKEKAVSEQEAKVQAEKDKAKSMPKQVIDADGHIKNMTQAEEEALPKEPTPAEIKQQEANDKAQADARIKNEKKANRDNALQSGKISIDDWLKDEVKSGLTEEQAKKDLKDFAENLKKTMMNDNDNSIDPEVILSIYKELGVDADKAYELGTDIYWSSTHMDNKNTAWDKRFDAAYNKIYGGKGDNKKESGAENTKKEDDKKSNEEIKTFDDANKYGEVGEHITGEPDELTDKEKAKVEQAKQPEAHHEFSPDATAQLDKLDDLIAKFEAKGDNLTPEEQRALNDLKRKRENFMSFLNFDHEDAQKYIDDYNKAHSYLDKKLPMNLGTSRSVALEEADAGINAAKDVLKAAKKSGDKEAIAAAEKSLKVAEANKANVKSGYDYFVFDKIATMLRNITIPGKYGKQGDNAVSAWDEKVRKDINAETDRHNKFIDEKFNTVEKMIGEEFSKDSKEMDILNQLKANESTRRMMIDMDIEEVIRKIRSISNMSDATKDLSFTDMFIYLTAHENQNPKDAAIGSASVKAANAVDNSASDPDGLIHETNEMWKNIFENGIQW